MIPRVSVALPVFSAAGTLRRAVDAVLRQTISELELLLVLNGSDAATRDVARVAALQDSRVRVIELAVPNLAAALNVAIREARAECVARMDADDECAPSRLEQQERFLQENPKVAFVGTAYQRRFADGTLCGVVIPPLSPEDVRWRLLLGNTMCHGSVMMRRDVLLAERGYDESCSKAQDFELWSRLSIKHQLANLPDVLYTYTVREPASLGVPSEAQSVIVADQLLAAWSRLPATNASAESCRVIADALAQSQLGGTRSARAVTRIEDILRADGPSREAIMAWMYANLQAQHERGSTLELCKPSRLRERGRELRDLGVRRLWLWGAGQHTRWVIEHRADLGVDIAGLCDDERAGETQFGFVIEDPRQLAAGSHLLVSSDAYEAEMLSRAGPLRERGVRVHGLYRQDPIGTTQSRPPTRHSASERVA